MKHLFALSLILAAGSLANADTLYVTRAPANGLGFLTGNLKGGVDFSLICNDYLHHTSVPSSWTVNVSTIPELLNNRFNYANAATELLNYEAAAYLMMQLTGVTNSATISDIQYAIWKIFDPALGIGAGAANQLSAALGKPLSAYDYSGVRIYTPTDPVNGTNQEFLAGSVVIPTDKVPEPSSWLMMLGGGLTVALLRRRKGYSTT